VNWRLAHFDDLSPREVHDIYRARIEVFVLEQNCPFQDVDGADPQCWHLMGSSIKGSATLLAGANKVADPFIELVAYSRLVPAGVKFAEPSIGRVLTTAAARGTGAGRKLMAESLVHAAKLWPGQAIRIGAQARLEKFYNEFGFAKASDVYIEDGIPHIEMIRP
jgi:ElaA protein